MANVEARGSLYYLSILSMFEVFCNFFLKNGKLGFKNRELLSNMCYKAVDVIGLWLVSIAMSNLSSDSK